MNQLLEGRSMRINCHCHVFNVQTIFTAKTKAILAQRLKDHKIPEPIANLILDMLGAIITSPGIGADPVKVYPDLTKRVIGLNKDITKEWRGVVRKLTPRDADGWSAQNMDGLLKALSWANVIKNWDALHGDPLDLLKFIYIAFMPSINQVTDHLLDQLEPGDAIVPLMMDIDPQETVLYQEQIEQTAAQSLRYPGRVLPFLAVHPRRPGALNILQREVDTGRFVGVKLYPSLGYKIEEAEEILTFCNDTHTPITMHCNEGGFYADKDFSEYSHPCHWWDILGNYKKLKICFAHFGGDDFNNPPKKGVCPKKPWTSEILKLMEAFPGRAFADISYHSLPMELEQKDYAAYEAYLRKLRRLIQDTTYGSQILWGTDYWLVQMRVDEKHYWDYFTARLGTRVFDQIARENPVRFLGLPDPEPALNIERHIKYLLSKTGKSNRKNMAPWIRDWVARKPEFNI